MTIDLNYAHFISKQLPFSFVKTVNASSLDVPFFSMVDLLPVERSIASKRKLARPSFLAPAIRFMITLFWLSISPLNRFQFRLP